METVAWRREPRAIALPEPRAVTRRVGGPGPDTTPLLGKAKLWSRLNELEHKPSPVHTAGAIAPIFCGLSPGWAWVCRSDNCVRMRFSSLGRIARADACCGASLVTADSEVGSRLLEPLTPTDMIVKVLWECRNNGQWWWDRKSADEFLSVPTVTVLMNWVWILEDNTRAWACPAPHKVVESKLRIGKTTIAWWMDPTHYQSGVIRRAVPNRTHSSNLWWWQSLWIDGQAKMWGRKSDACFRWSRWKTKVLVTSEIHLQKTGFQIYNR